MDNCASLPADPQSTQERQLYHAQRSDQSWATMTQDGGTWQWRRLRGEGYGSGTWSEMQAWLKG